MTPASVSAEQHPDDDRDPTGDRQGRDDHERPLLAEDRGPPRPSERPAPQPPPHPWETLGMADALPVVIVAVTVLAALIGLATLASSGRSWEQVGRGGLSLRDGSDRPDDERVAGGP